jgi:pyridoxal phosphate enzyme (YggS family)
MDFSTNLNSIRQTIEAACARVGRDPASVLLVAVSKGHPPEKISEAAAAGQTVFGESRVQEARVKIEQCPGHLRWHLIGHLQSNKCRQAVELFEMVESVDSVPLAQEISKWANHEAKTMPVLLEVNVAGEATKFGFKPDQLLSVLSEINALSKIEIHGLMTIAPWTADPEKVRPIFRRLRELKEQADEILGAPLRHLSMGMSGDFAVAIEEGATIVRIGTAVFGPRSRQTRTEP